MTMSRTHLGMRVVPLLLVAMTCAARLAPASAAEPRATVTVRVDQPGHKVSPLLHGIFFEEINRAGDGGLYAEMVQNRSFEDNEAEPAAWWLVKSDGAAGTVNIDTSTPLNDENRRSLRLDVARVGEGGRVGIANGGFKGMAVREAAGYVLSFAARANEGFRGPLAVSLERGDGTVLAADKVTDVGGDWKRFECRLVATGTDTAAHLVIAASSPGTVWLDTVSLLPAETWKGRGLRPDLAQMIADMRPGFVRFPGGCWVEGETMATAYRWKQTIGDVARRRNHYNLWRYHSTHGLGYHEYLQFCEDLGAEPLFVINCGMSHRENVPMDKMGEYVQDALDAIEYANGPADSEWGSVRAKNGRRESFKLKYLQIGNENGGPAYDERYALFYDAIKKHYPDVNLIANLWQGRPRSRPIEILDEHYYNTPGWFFANASRYDSYDRNGPKIYVGEFAVTRGQVGQGNLRAAVAEAAFMTGLERNSDVVVMSSYAPLLAHVGYKVWNPDAIYFDASRAVGTPSYHVQRLFAENRPDVVLPVEVDAEAPAEPQRGAVGVGTWRTQAEFKDVRVVAAAADDDGRVLFESDFTNGLPGWRELNGRWAVTAGTLRQSGNQEGAFAVAGDPEWSDYTLTLKARKVGGDEGFLVRIHSTDADNYAMWNIGGWGNERHQIEVSDGGGKVQIGQPAPGRIETGRWYDVRVECRGEQIRCFLDGQLVHDVRRPRPKPIYATAGRRGDEVMVKVANGSPRAYEMSVRLDGAATVQPRATAIVLTSASPDDENTLDEPTKVVPVTREIDVAGSELRHTLPGFSVTVLRVRAGAT
jgi:alpha-L-arabinofuranosidase